MQEAYIKVTNGTDLLFQGEFIIKKLYLVCQLSKADKEYIAMADNI